MCVQVKIGSFLTLSYLISILCIIILGEGYFAELLMWIILGGLFFTNNKRLALSKNELWVRRVFFIVASLFFFLMFIHFRDGTFQVVERLYGITKCICLPYIVFLCLQKKTKSESLFAFAVYIISFINIIYIIRNTIYGNFLSMIDIGSVNIVGALNLLIIPWMIYRKKYYFSLLISVIGIGVYDSGTYYLCGIYEILQSIIIVYFKPIPMISTKWLISFFRWSIIIVLIFLGLWIYFYDIWDLDNSNIDIDKSRIHLWTFAALRFLESDLTTQVLGTGEIIIHLSEASQQTHNLLFDLLMFDGVAGVVLYLILIIVVVGSIKYLASVKPLKAGILIVITLTMGLASAFYHPLLTACTTFSFMSGVLFSYYYGVLEKT